MRPEHPKPEHISALRALWQEAFGDTPAFLDGFFSTAFAPGRCLCIREGEQVLSAVYWLDAELAQGKGAYLYALATARAHRGRGFAHALMEAAHEELRAQDCCAAILVPGSPELASLYASLGYRFFGGIRAFSTLAQTPGVALRKIGGDEYAALRRQYLPAGAVRQEKENIRFLETYAEFYTGKDFLLAAYREGDTVSGLELLGNAEKAPRILETLGAKQGIFRVPGEAPFAMWLPLKDGQAPGYFGLAFD